MARKSRDNDPPSVNDAMTVVLGNFESFLFVQRASLHSLSAQCLAQTARELFRFRILIVRDLRLKVQASKQHTHPQVITIWQTYQGRLEKTELRHTQALMATGLFRVVMELICKRRFSYCQKRFGRPEVGTSGRKCLM